jgi:NADH-dependent peroxiredoxin subunit F
LIEDVNTKEEKTLLVNGIFAEIGYEVNTELIKGLAELTEFNEIRINDLCHTSVPGIFAAGDCTQIKYKQAVISAGEGVKAALSACAYVSGKDRIELDWKR